MCIRVESQYIMDVQGHIVNNTVGRMANSLFWDGLFPGSNDSPAETFGLDGKEGPQYIAALSGTELQTQHLGYLMMEKSKEVEPEEITGPPGRKTSPVCVAYLDMNHIYYDVPVQPLPLRRGIVYALIAIFSSVVTCLMCALVHDWFSFSMILIGIISNGWATTVIGKGRLAIDSVTMPARGAPPGHGILMGKHGVVVIKGKERDVNAITKGHFDLMTDSQQQDKGQEKEQEKEKEKEPKKPRDEEKGTVRSYHAIGICSLVLLVQFLAQLLLVPQGTLFGQIMFLISLGVSWGYNSYLSSLEKEKIQIQILFRKLGDPKMLRFRTSTRTMMTVFVCLLLFHGVEPSSPKVDRTNRDRILKKCISNETPVWLRWREKVINQLLNIDEGSQSSPYLAEDDADKEQFTPEEGGLLKQLLGDADAAFKGYFRIRGELDSNSGHEHEAQGQ